jgi:hypothetical protein
MDTFEVHRRQRFLSKQYCDWLLPQLTDEIAYWKEHDTPVGSTEAERKYLTAMLQAMAYHKRFLLEYTGGKSVVALRDDFPLLIDALEHETLLHRAAKDDSGMPPLRFGEIGDYEQTMQVISLCHLLHRTDLLPRIADMFDPFYRAQDTLYEDLLAYGMDDRYDVDKWFHDKPYRLLINSFYRDTEEESIDDIKAYLDAWYPAMKDAPGHDSHLTANEEEGGSYVGYWAIEAAAATFLLELDDSSYRDHLLYPKDLVDFARSFQAGQGADGHGSNRLSLRCEAGQPCPKTGYWMTPAKAGSRRYFQQGEVMPTVTSDYGSTIWQWDNDQSDPKL